MDFEKIRHFFTPANYPATPFALDESNRVADSMVQNQYGTDLLWYRRGIWLC